MFFYFLSDKEYRPFCVALVTFSLYPLVSGNSKNFYRHPFRVWIDSLINYITKRLRSLCFVWVWYDTFSSVLMFLFTSLLFLLSDVFRSFQINLPPLLVLRKWEADHEKTADEERESSSNQILTLCFLVKNWGVTLAQKATLMRRKKEKEKGISLVLQTKDGENKGVVTKYFQLLRAWLIWVLIVAKSDRSSHLSRTSQRVSKPVESANLSPTMITWENPIVYQRIMW